MNGVLVAINMNNTNKRIEEFETEMERCLNEYWHDLTPLEKERYITSLTQQVREEERDLSI